MATEFQKSVWDAMRLIPRGKVTTYAQIAAFLRRPAAVRAVGTAVGKNPYAPTVPCHRVVRSDGSVGNYSGGEGVATKVAYLKEEGVLTEGGRIVGFVSRLYRFEDQQRTRSAGS